MSEQAPEVIPPQGEPVSDPSSEAVQSPAKVMRIGAMTKELLEEVRRSPLDEAARTRMRDIFETSVTELAEVLSDDLRDELGRLASPFAADAPSDAELRVAQAQLVGWLEGLFHGIQAALFAQQMQMQAQLQQQGRRPLPPGQPGPGPDGGPAPAGGQYL